MAKHSLPKRTKRAKDFPLWVHPSGRWCKKIKGRFHYFGRVSDDTHGEKALAEWLRVRDDLLAGRTAPPPGGLELRDVCNAFIASKERAVTAGELRPCSFGEYHGLCAQMIGFFGGRRQVSSLVASDFSDFRAMLAKRYGPAGLTKRIQLVRSVFKYAWEAGLIEHPPRYGPEFKKPSAKTVRLAKAERGDRLLTAEEIRKLLSVSSVQMRAMILLGVNAALGNTDVATLPKDAIDFKAGILTFPRPKTGIPRRAVLWPETLKALKAAIAGRPKPKVPEDDRLVFITKYGRGWMRYRPRPDGTGVWVNSVGLQFGKAMRAAGTDKPGAGFYTCRRVFRTVADELPDRGAIDLVMGHEDPADMRTHYVARISDDRLRTLADHIRRWLYPKAAKPRRRAAAAKKTVDPLTQPAVE